MDVVGNVMEWVYDWFDTQYYQQSPYYNPQGPSSGSMKLWRGGHFGVRYYDAENWFRENYYDGYWSTPRILQLLRRLPLRRYSATLRRAFIQTPFFINIRTEKFLGNK